jgi:predicted dienelactone hydrolase
VVTAANPDEAFWSSFIVRPMAIPHAIDFAENLNRMDGSFQGLIDTQHIGVAGHSSGGYTALAAGGAQLDLAWFETWCAGPAPHFACAELLGHKEEMLALAGLDSMPTSLWLGWGDPRVSAIVSKSVPGFVFGSSGLASVTIPVMIQLGSNDSVVPPEWAGSLAYDSISSTQKAQVVFENGNHVMFFTGGKHLNQTLWDGIWITLAIS